MTKGGREGDDVLGTVRRQAPVYWANMQSNWRCSQYCDPPLSWFASDRLLFQSPSVDGTQVIMALGARSREQSPEILVLADGERRRKPLMRVSTFGALKSPKALRGTHGDEWGRKGMTGMAVGAMWLGICLVLFVPGQRASWLLGISPTSCHQLRFWPWHIARKCMWKMTCWVLQMAQKWTAERKGPACQRSVQGKRDAWRGN